MPETVLAILTDTNAGGLAGPARECLGLAAEIAAIVGADLAAATYAAPGSAAVTEAGERGASRVFALPEAGLDGSDALVASAALAVAASGATYVVVNRGAEVLDLVPRLAARLGGGCVMGVTEVRAAPGGLQAVAAIYGGAARAVYRFGEGGPRVMSAAAGAAEPPARLSGRPATVVSLELPAPSSRVRVVEAIAAPDGPRLEDARIVVSGGRGLRDGENYGLIRELAAALGGMPGASRAIVDDAWAAPTEQVGLTGKIVTPQVYFAIGISGASQHMAGCSNSKLLVAINTDPEAPIFRYAHLGIVENCLDLLPELVRLAKERTR
ncbi:MAG: electron transfer flavoprotein subunit alpha/FixB family protein [Dehalococcoidia bacterium]